MTEAERITAIREHLTDQVKKYDRLLLDLEKTSPPPVIRILSRNEIINGLCNFYKIDIDDLTKRSRGKNTIKRRKFAIRLLRKYTNTTLSQIAEIMHYKEHATVIHHLRTTDDMLSEDVYGDRDFKIEYAELLNYLHI